MNTKLVAYLATLGYKLIHQGGGEYEGSRIDGGPMDSEELAQLERNVQAWYERQKLH